MLSKTKRLTTWLTILAVASLPFQAVEAAPKKPKKPAAGAPHKAGKPKGAQASGAKKHLDAGTKAFKARNYEVAARELELAYKASPRPATLRMLADAQQQTKDYVASYESYAKLLADHGDTLSRADRDNAERAMKSLESMTAMLDVTVDEAGAAIFVDGNQVGKSPLKAPVRVTATAHKIRATANAFDPIEQDVEPKPGEKLAVTLRFVPDASAEKPVATGAGKIKVTSTPTDATIEIDGKEVGTGTYEGDLPAGKHHLVVRAAGFQSFIQDLTIESGETAERDAKLDPEDGSTRTEAVATGSSYEGLYFNAALFGAYPISGQVRQPIDAEYGERGSASTQLGGGAALHVGYSFGLISLEVAGAFLGERHTEKKNIPGYADVSLQEYQDGEIARLESFTMQSLGGFGGLGPRVTSPGETVRVSFGVTPGLSFRKYSVSRATSGAILDTYRASATKVAFGALADLSLMIGKTPGTKFIVGVSGWADFPGDVVTPSGDPREISFDFDGEPVTAVLPTPPYTLGRGMQFFIGPHIGLQFGH